MYVLFLQFWVWYYWIIVINGFRLKSLNNIWNQKSLIRHYYLSQLFYR